MGRASLRLHRVAWWAVLLFFAVSTITGAPAVAAPQNAGQSDVTTRELLLERDVSDLRSNAPLVVQASKDVTRVEAQQHEVNTRVDDLKARIGDLTIAISLIAPFLTMLAILVGIAAYSAAGKRAEAAAEDWMEKRAAQLQKRIEGLESEAEKIAESMRQRKQTVFDHGDEIEKDMAQRAQSVNETIGRLESQMNAEKALSSNSTAVEPSASDQKTMKQVEDDLKAKPEKEYTAEDWAQRAFAAYAERAFDRAAFYFQQAADASGDTPGDWAKYTVNRGGMLGELGRIDEEIAFYDIVVARFGAATELALREQVVRALFNKGVALGSLNRSEEAIATYDAVVARAGDATDLISRERAAKALFNKGATFGILNRDEDAVVVYDAVVERYGEASEPILREAVARALVSKGVALARLNRSEEAAVAYGEVTRRFGDSVEDVLKDIVKRAVEYRKALKEA